MIMGALLLFGSLKKYLYKMVYRQPREISELVLSLVLCSISHVVTFLGGKILLWIFWQLVEGITWVAF